MKWILFATIIMSVVFDAISDAMRDNKRKTPMHIWEALTILSFMGSITIMVFIDFTAWDILFCYVLLYPAQRVMFFDIVYNLTRKPRLPFWYIGDTDWWDRGIRKINMAPDTYLWFRFIVWLGYTGFIMLNYKA